MRCQFNNKECNECDECDEHLTSCDNCNFIDAEGDCDNTNSCYYGDWVEGTVRCCAFFERQSINTIMR